MKAVAVILLTLVISAFGIELHCKLPETDIPQRWRSMHSECINKMRSQVQEELTAAMTYLAMGTHFLQDSVNRPGFAKFFLESASEEREHAMKIIQYLLMRGELTSEIGSLIRDPRPVETQWFSGVDALKSALELETNVTNKIRDIVIICEEPKIEPKFNDYHLVDWMTGEFLEEQYKGQRDLAGKISTLGKMMKEHGELGEFLFDKRMLKGEA